MTKTATGVNTDWHCRVCGGSGRFESYWAHEQLRRLDEVFEYRLCPDCGCLQIAEIPDDLGRYYGSDYYSMREPPQYGWLTRALLRASNHYQSGRFNPVGAWVAWRYPFHALAALRPLRLSHDARILDVGCGRGVLLQALQSIGFKRLLGVDPFIARDLDLGGGLQVRRAELAELAASAATNGADGAFDVVMFHHSLEHIDDESGVLRAAHAVLAPGGHCIVRIPTVDSYAWRHYGVDWSELCPPYHLTLHSRRSIVLLVERCGFQVMSVKDDSNQLQFWGSEQCRRGIALMRDGAVTPLPGQFTDRELRGFERRALALNRRGDGDLITVYLKHAV
jgi:SAM-dependent methyltransferase